MVSPSPNLPLPQSPPPSLDLPLIPISTHLHPLQSLEESEGHTATYHHLVHLVQQVVNQLNLVMHLGSVWRQTDRQKGRQIDK